MGDVAALVLIASGAAIYMYAQHRMGDLAAGRMQHDALSGSGGGWNLAIWSRMITVSRVALGLVAGGVVVGVASTAWQARRRSLVSAHEQADDQRPA